MPGQVVQQLINEIVFQTDGRSEQKAKASLDDVKSAALGVAGALGAAGIGGALLKLTRDFANTADEAVKAARNLGLPVETLLELEHAGALSGVQVDRLRDGIKDLQKNSVEAARGAKEMSKDFRRLGINAGKFSRLPVDQKLELIADGLQKIPNGAERAQIRMRLLGESGLHMGNLLDNGSESVRRMRIEARQLGVVFDEEVAKRAEAMNDALERSKRSVDGLTFPLADELIPVVTETANEFTKLIQAIDKQEIREIGRLIGSGLRFAFQGILDVSRVIVNNLQLFKAALIGIAGASIIANFGKLVSLMRSIAALASLSSAQFLLGAAAIAAIFLAVDDFIAFLEGRPSVIADLIGDPEEIEMYRRAFEIFFQDIVDTFSGEGEDPLVDWILRNISEAHEQGVDAMVPFFQETADMFVRWQESLTMEEFTANLKRDLDQVYEDFKGFMGSVSDSVSEGVDFMADKIQAFIDYVIGAAGRAAGALKSVIAAPREAAAGLLDSLPGLGRGSTTRAIAGALGGGALNPAFDRAAQRARVVNNSTTRDVSVDRIEVNVPNSGNMSPEQLAGAVATGVQRGVTEADLRRAGRSVDGAMQ